MFLFFLDLAIYFECSFLWIFKYFCMRIWCTTVLVVLNLIFDILCSFNSAAPLQKLWHMIWYWRLQWKYRISTKEICCCMAHGSGYSLSLHHIMGFLLHTPSWGKQMLIVLLFCFHARIIKLCHLYCLLSFLSMWLLGSLSLEHWIVPGTFLMWWMWRHQHLTVLNWYTIYCCL